MESLLLHCRTFARTPEDLVVYEDKEIPKTASEARPDGPPEANKSLERRELQVESKVSRTEVGIEIPTRTQFQEIWKNAPEALKEELREPIDEMELGLRRLDVYQEVEKLAKDKGEVYAAVKQYEWAARRFNQIVGSKVFPENLTTFDWKNPRDAKEDERRVAFAQAREVYDALNINYTDNPKLDPAPVEEPGRTAEKAPVMVLGKADVKALVKTKTAQIKNILEEIGGKTKTLNLSLADCKELLALDLASVRDPAVEKGDTGRESTMNKLRAFVISHAWEEHISPLIREKDQRKPKYDLRPASRFGEMIATNVSERDRLKGHVFEITPKAGVPVSPGENAQAAEAEEFLHANWKQVVYMYGNEPEIVPMLGNIDVRRNNDRQTEIWTDVKNVPEANAIKKQPFSRTILSSPAGILLTVLGYFTLDAKGKSLLTKFIIGAFAVEKVGGTEGLAALAHQLGDQIPWAKKMIQDVLNGNVNLKTKEYSRSTFEKWSGLEGIQAETRDWMLRESDGLSEAKKLGIYVILNDQPVKKVREMVNKKPPNSPGSIGEYIEKWQVEGRGSWRDKPGTSSWQRVKSISQKLATGTANAAGKSEKYVEEFLFGGIMNITPPDVENFFKAKIEDDKGQPTKTNPMRATIEDTNYDKEQFENALRRKFPEGGRQNPRATPPAPKTTEGPGAGDEGDGDDGEEVVDNTAPNPVSTPSPKAPRAKPEEEAGKNFFGEHAGFTEVTYSKVNEGLVMSYKYDGKNYVASEDKARPGAFEVKEQPRGYALWFPDRITFEKHFADTAKVADKDGGYTIGLLCNTALRNWKGEYSDVRLDLGGDTDGALVDGKQYSLSFATKKAAPYDRITLRAAVVAGGPQTFKVHGSNGQEIVQSDFINGADAAQAVEEAERVPEEQRALQRMHDQVTANTAVGFKVEGPVHGPKISGFPDQYYFDFMYGGTKYYVSYLLNKKKYFAGEYVAGGTTKTVLAGIPPSELQDFPRFAITQLFYREYLSHSRKDAIYDELVGKFLSPDDARYVEYPTWSGIASPGAVSFTFNRPGQRTNYKIYKSGRAANTKMTLGG